MLIYNNPLIGEHYLETVRCFSLSKSLKYIYNKFISKQIKFVIILVEKDFKSNFNALNFKNN